MLLYVANIAACSVKEPWSGLVHGLAATGSGLTVDQDVELSCTSWGLGTAAVVFDVNHL